MSRSIIICRDCGEKKPLCGKGLCRKCYARKWRFENKERERETSRKWYSENKEKKRETSSRRYSRNPEKIRRLAIQKSHRRRAIMNDLPATLTPQDWQEILDVWDYRCAYCGKHTFKLEQEHVTPITQGGGYTIENIVPACRSCNAKKSSKTPIEAGMSFYYQETGKPYYRGLSK